MVLLSILVLGSNNVLKKWIFLQGFGKCVLFLRWLKPHGCVVVSRVGTAVVSWVTGAVICSVSGEWVLCTLTSDFLLFFV